MKNHQPCAEWVELLALRSEDLSPADRANLAAHLGECPSCATTRAHYQRILVHLHAFPAPDLTPPPGLSLRKPVDEQKERHAHTISTGVGQSKEHDISDSYQKSRNSKKTVLIIDDNPTILELIKYAVTIGGEYDIIVAYDWLQGLERVYSEQPDCIIIDVKTPSMEGYQLVRHLRGDPLTHDIPFIVLSAIARRQDQLASYLTGTDEYLTKPFRPSALHAALDRTLRAAPADRQRHSASFTYTQAGRDEVL